MHLNLCQRLGLSLLFLHLCLLLRVMLGLTCAQIVDDCLEAPQHLLQQYVQCVPERTTNLCFDGQFRRSHLLQRSVVSFRLVLRLLGATKLG